MILDLIVRRAKEAGYTSLYIKHSLRLVKPLICIRNGDFSCWMVNSEIPGIRQPVYSCSEKMQCIHLLWIRVAFTVASLFATCFKPQTA